MLKLKGDDLQRHSVKYFEAAASGSGALMFDGFAKKTLKTLYGNTDFPREVRLCKSLEEMIEGDFSPSEVIRMEPPTLNGIPIWRGSTVRDNGVVLRGAGYVNGDSRKPCHVALDDTVPHGLLAGATGHGKSVTLNSVINTACLEYPPWEVQFVLVDAKIVEFKAYGMKSVIPHISSIAATGDAEFIISVLEDACSTMMLRNNVFTKAQAKNIKSFRESTGLAMPHIMIVMDEFQTMFMNAARKAKYINELIARVARLGRNTGVHLLLASQELGSDLDKSVMGNVGTRLCLGCLPGTSTQILGNPTASANYKQKGRLIINNDPGRENNADLNVNLRTPFLPDKKKKGDDFWTLFDYMDALEKIGRQAKPSPFYPLAFYDEEEKCYEEKFREYVKGRAKHNRLYLGEPSFVLRNGDGEKWLRMDLKNDVGQNILVYSPMKVNRTRYLRMISHNLYAARESGEQIQVQAFYSNKEAFAEIDMGLAARPVYTREFDESVETAIGSAFARRVLIECDEEAFGGVEFDEDDMKLFDENLNSEGRYNGELWRKRAQALMRAFIGQHAKKLGLDALSGDGKTSRTLGYVAGYLDMFAKLGCAVKKVTLDAFKPMFVFVQGLELMSGLGVDSRTQRVEAFKKIINEAPEYKVFFIISTSTMEDCMGLRSAVMHVLCDNLNSSMQGHLKLGDSYPETCAPTLGIYYLSTQERDKCRKFKKMLFKGEVV